MHLAASVYPSVCPSVHTSVRPSIRPSIHLSELLQISGRGRLAFNYDYYINGNDLFYPSSITLSPNLDVVRLSVSRSVSQY